MKILNAIEQFIKEEDLINESGLRNIRELAKKYNKCEIYCHMDLDGMTSAIGIKSYLENYGIKTVDVHPLNYGSQEYAIPMPKKGYMAVLVDFAHGKPVMSIHLDHHDNQIGFEVTKQKGATSFVKSPSNAAYITQKLSPRDIFPSSDADIINMVDSADFAKIGIKPDDLMRAVFKVDKSLDVTKNRMAMGLAVNKLVLAYKNKPGFIKELVMLAKPSLLSMYNVTIKLAKEAGYKPPEDVESGTAEYVLAQKDKSTKDVKIKDLKSGQSTMFGKTIVQYGGGGMFNGYDRYTPFKNYPDAHYLIIVWPMGLIQVSKNPFSSGNNPYILSDIAWKVMEKFKRQLSNIVTLDFIKYLFDKEIKDSGMGFRVEDLFANFKGLIKADKDVSKDDWKKLPEIMSKPYNKLSYDDKDFLKRFKITCWDILKAQSGGHKDITNISGFSFYGKGYVDLMKKIMFALAMEMKDKRLK